MKTKKFRRDRRLTERTVRPGCRVMKLDPTKTGEPRFPWQRKRKRQAKEAQNQLEHLRRVGHVSMIQIGTDEFRTPNRAERRAAGIKRPRTRVEHRGKLNPKRAVHLTPSEELAAAQETGKLVRMRPYTRRAKSRRKGVAELIRGCQSADEVYAVLESIGADA